MLHTGDVGGTYPHTACTGLAQEQWSSVKKHRLVERNTSLVDPVYSGCGRRTRPLRQRSSWEQSNSTRTTTSTIAIDLTAAFLVDLCGRYIVIKLHVNIV